ncbi:MAG: hypothetical protein JNL74_00350 [Fibrobacteres bacterium]|nr:hypothetical protein [Fibrobacterota bacterium]
MIKALCLAALFSAISLTAAPTQIMSDFFDYDSGAWTPLLGSSKSIANGQLELASTSKTGQAWVVNTKLSNDLTKDISFSAKTVFLSADTNARIGLTVRTQDNMDAYHYYIYPSGAYIIYRYVGGVWTNFSNNYLMGNTFIRSDTNTIEVMTYGNKLYFLCNNYPVDSVIDTSVSVINSAGRLGLIVSGKCRAAFLETEASAGDPIIMPSSFRDDFSKTALVGWKNYGGIGSFAVSGGVLRATCPANSQIVSLLSNGSYSLTDTIEVSATPQAPIPTGNYNYGLIFHYNQVMASGGSMTTQAYHFCVVNGTHYTILKQSESGVVVMFTPVASISISANGPNKLKVINHAGGLKDLYINGTKVGSYTDNSYPTGGVGLMLNGGVAVNFDDFEVRGLSTVAVEKMPTKEMGNFNISISPNPFRPVTNIHVAGVTGNYMLNITDIQGRTVSSVKCSGNSIFTWDAKGKPAGFYTASIISSGKKLLTKRLLLVK